MTRASLLAALVALTGCATLAPPPARHAPEPSSVASAPAGHAADAPADASGPREAGPDEGAAAPPGSGPEAVPPEGGLAPDLRARLVARARSLLARRGPFHVAGERFNGDCSGYVQSVYAAEGIDLRGVMERTAPRERRGVVAAWLAAREHGSAFGAEARPEPGDLVFWHDTYDRNRNGKADDPFTHVGIVEHVEDGTVSFLHRGAKGVARGVMTLDQRRVATARDGRRLNSPLRARAHPAKKGGLAGELFAGYGRVDAPRVAAGEATATPKAAAPPARKRKAPPAPRATKRAAAKAPRTG